LGPSRFGRLYYQYVRLIYLVWGVRPRTKRKKGADAVPSPFPFLVLEVGQDFVPYELHTGYVTYQSPVLYVSPASFLLLLLAAEQSVWVGRRATAPQRRIESFFLLTIFHSLFPVTERVHGTFQPCSHSPRSIFLFHPSPITSSIAKRASISSRSSTRP